VACGTLIAMLDQLGADATEPQGQDWEGWFSDPENKLKF
jgi:hypothetical protein